MNFLLLSGGLNGLEDQQGTRTTNDLSNHVLQHLSVRNLPVHAHDERNHGVQVTRTGQTRGHHNGDEQTHTDHNRNGVRGNRILSEQDAQNNEEKDKSAGGFREQVLHVLFLVCLKEKKDTNKHMFSRSFKFLVRQHWVWIACITILVVFILAWWTRRPVHRKRLRVARERLTAPSLAIRGSGADPRQSNESIADSIQDFADIANDERANFLDRARAMNWLSQVYRVGWGPYRRNPELAQRWARAGGLRFSEDLDLNDVDDRHLTLPVFEPKVTESIQIPDQRTMNAIRQIQEETATEVLHQQNVHNSGVTSSVHDILMKYHRMYPMSSDAQTVQAHMADIRNRITNHPDRERSRVALQVLDRMESSVTPLVRSGLTESQILSLVWSRKHDLNTSPEQTIELLIDRLNDCIEHQSIVCTTGRVTHVIDTWSGIDQEVKLRTKEQAKEERLRNVQRLVSECVSRMHPIDQKRWNEEHAGIEDLRKRVTDYTLAHMNVGSDHMNEVQQWIQSL